MWTNGSWCDGNIKIAGTKVPPKLRIVVSYGCVPLLFHHDADHFFIFVPKNAIIIYNTHSTHSVRNNAVSEGVFARKCVASLNLKCSYANIAIFEIENSCSCAFPAWQIRFHCEEYSTMARKKISSSDYCALLWRTMNMVRAQERVEWAIEKVYIYEKYPFRGNNNIFGINARWQKFSIEMRISAIVAYQKIQNFAQFHVRFVVERWHVILDLEYNIYFHVLLFQEIESIGITTSHQTT